MRLQNKIAIVTGASTGIGREVSLALAKEGATVGLVARNREGLNETKRLVEQENGKAVILLADLSIPDGINNLIQEIKSQFPEIHILANIAGIWHGKDEVYAGLDFEKFNQKVILDTFNVGTNAPALLVHGLLPIMKQKAKIINLSGTFENGGKGWIPYYVSKRAIEDLTIGLAQELQEKDIQVNCVSPSDTATDAYKKYFPEYIDESVDPKEIATLFVKLCLPESNDVSGKVFIVKKDEEVREGFHK